MPVEVRKQDNGNEAQSVIASVWRNVQQHIRLCILAAVVCLGNGNALHAQMTVVIGNDTMFADTLLQDLYLAGNFNDWDPAGEAYRFHLVDGEWQATFDLPKKREIAEFKCVRGEWGKEEVKANGDAMNNRSFYYHVNTRVVIDIATFRDMIPQKPAERNERVITYESLILHTDYYKTIRVYLPCDYDSSQKRYPVLYMLDGQNLFDDITSFAGEWGIDEAMDSICTDGYTTAIIVGIDNGGENRINEYAPWEINEEYGGGDGDKFARYVVDFLKPHIDKEFRTLPDREHTGIGGSSLGGMMSHYMVLKYNEVFGFGLIFSPSFWAGEGNVETANAFNSQLPTKLYYLVGGMEDEDDEAINDAIDMYQLMLAKHINTLELRLTINSSSTHSESFWRAEFPAGYLWLFED